MPDMLVKLYDLKDEIPELNELENKGIYIKRVLALDRHLVLDYVKTTFNEGWVNECAFSLSNNPATCFVAVKDKKIIGFACYDATAKNFFGPTGVTETFRGNGIGKVLLLKCLLSMKNDGYGYAIIGWVSDALNFYKKAVGAIVIENSEPGIYRRMVGIE